MYVEPNIKSSYLINNKGAEYGELYFKPNIGKTIYDYVIETEPKIIVEFGVLFGFSTICMAQAIRDLNNNGRIYAFDLWEQSEYNHGQTMKMVQDNLDKFDLQQFVNLKHGGDISCISDIKDIDLIHIDINNDGDNLKKLISDIKSIGSDESDILFEGGIHDRDVCWWMKKFNKTPISNIKNQFDYVILNERYPGISKCI